MAIDVASFKAYDIRGIYPDQINARFMYALGKAYATWFQPGNAVIGYDSRLSSVELGNALSEGLRDSGVDVLDLGLCGSEMVYFATGKYEKDGGLMITASHNPKDFNGCKMVAKGAKPVGEDSGLQEIKDLVANEGPFYHVNGKSSGNKGSYEKRDITPDFLSHTLGMLTRKIDPDLKVVVNSGNGASGPLIINLAEKLPCSLFPLFTDPDGNFPNGVPNPLLTENRQDTANAIIKHKADLGVAFDGDFDRCFFFDENGRFIEGYYIVGLMAQQMLNKYPGGTIIHDPRLTWHTIEVVCKAGGNTLMSKTGHAFIKSKMREAEAVYAGEMSAHHYFRDFWYCDTGIVPFLLLLEVLSNSDKKMSEMMDEAFEQYPVSGEINYKIEGDPLEVVDILARDYEQQGGAVAYPDGLTVDFDQWRFSLRVSNTEPLLRLNVETKADKQLLKEKTEELSNKIQSFAHR